MIKGGVQIIRMEIYDVFFFHEGEGGFEFHIPILKNDLFKNHLKLDPVGSTVRYEIMKLCTGSVLDSNCWYMVVLSQWSSHKRNNDVTGLK